MKWREMCQGLGSKIFASIGTLWQNGMIRDVSFAAWIAAIFAVPTGSSFGTVPALSARSVAGFTRSLEAAFAILSVAVLSLGVALQ